jgi:hypothetical protein
VHTRKKIIQGSCHSILNFKIWNRTELKAGSFFFYAKILYHALFGHEIVSNFQTYVLDTILVAK